MMLILSEVLIDMMLILSEVLIDLLSTVKKNAKVDISRLTEKRRME